MEKDVGYIERKFLQIQHEKFGDSGGSPILYEASLEEECV